MFKKFKIILSKKQLGSFYFFVFLSLVSMILETLGVGLIIPFMQTLMGDEVNQYLVKFFYFFYIRLNKNSFFLIVVFKSPINILILFCWMLIIWKILFTNGPDTNLYFKISCNSKKF